MPDVELPDPDEILEKAEHPFTRQVARFVAVYTVALAITALGGNNAGKERNATWPPAAIRISTIPHAVRNDVFPSPRLCWERAG